MTGNLCVHNNWKAPGPHRAGLLGHLRLRLRHHLRDRLLRVLPLGLRRSRLVLLWRKIQKHYLNAICEAKLYVL